MNCIRSIYKNVWRSVLLQYYLSSDKACRVTRMYVNYSDDMILYDDGNGNRKLIYKEDLYDAFRKDGFRIADQVINGYCKVYLSIPKDEISAIMKKGREKKFIKSKKVTHVE